MFIIVFTIVMFISVLSFRDTVLQPCGNVGKLGVVFGSALSWDAHVSDLSRRCTGLLIGLLHARNRLPDGVIGILVTALVNHTAGAALSF